MRMLKHGVAFPMPIYEYACATCGHRFDVRQSFSDEPVTDCTKCGALVRRVLHPAGVIFKGSGWYVTDSRKSADASKAKAESTNSTAPAPDSAGDKSPAPAKEPAAAASDD
jgi:putative FmdB family regulatory protein